MRETREWNLTTDRYDTCKFFAQLAWVSRLGFSYVFHKPNVSRSICDRPKRHTMCREGTLARVWWIAVVAASWRYTRTSNRDRPTRAPTRDILDHRRNWRFIKDATAYKSVAVYSIWRLPAARGRTDVSAWPRTIRRHNGSYKRRKSHCRLASANDAVRCSEYLCRDSRASELASLTSEGGCRCTLRCYHCCVAVSKTRGRSYLAKAASNASNVSMLDSGQKSPHFFSPCCRVLRPHLVQCVLGPQEFPPRTIPRSVQPFLHNSAAYRLIETPRYGIIGCNRPFYASCAFDAAKLRFRLYFILHVRPA